MYEISKKNMSPSYFWSFNIHILGHRAFERQVFKYKSFIKADRIGYIRKKSSVKRNRAW